MTNQQRWHREELVREIDRAIARLERAGDHAIGTPRAIRQQLEAAVDNLDNMKHAIHALFREV